MEIPLHLKAVENPVEATTAKAGRYLVEVFPALALPSCCEDFCRQGGAAKYNPENRKKFRSGDWKKVATIAAEMAREFACEGAEEWCVRMAGRNGEELRKSHQDELDAVLCLMIALRWKFRRKECVMIGDLENGYMITPACTSVRERLKLSANKRGVPII